MVGRPTVTSEEVNGTEVRSWPESVGSTLEASSHPICRKNLVDVIRIGQVQTFVSDITDLERSIFSHLSFHREVPLPRVRGIGAWIVSDARRADCASADQGRRDSQRAIDRS